MAFPVKRVRTLEERLRIIGEVEKNPSEKRIDVAKRLGLPPSTLNSIIAKKRDIIEQAYKCGALAKKRKTGKESTYSELENVLFAWYQQARASGMPVDGTILREISLKIAATMGIENFTASNGWVSRFKQRHGLVFKKVAGENATEDTSATGLWFERLPELLEAYNAQATSNAEERAVATCPEERCVVAGSGSCVEKRQGDGGGHDDVAQSEPVPSFVEALRAFETMRAFMYAHDITERDQANIINIERLLLRLKGKDTAKQRRVNDLFKKEIIQTGLDNGNHE
jgi:hypothetical protein